jgi:uncharacterized protein YhfF
MIFLGADILHAQGEREMRESIHRFRRKTADFWEEEIAGVPIKPVACDRGKILRCA